MVNWEGALQISLLGGALVFAYIASTFSVTEDSIIGRGVKMFLYLVSMGLVIASVGTNFAIIDSNDATLLQYTNGTSKALGFALIGTFKGLIGVVSFIFIILIYATIREGIEHYNLNKKKKEEGLGED